MTRTKNKAHFLKPKRGRNWNYLSSFPWCVTQNAIISITGEILEMFTVQMFYSCDCTESDIIVELTINSSTEICDNRDINGDLKGWSPFNMLYLHAAFCWVNPMAHTERHDCMVLSWDDIRNDLGPMSTLHTVSYFHILAEFERCLLNEYAAGGSSLSPISEVSPMWIPEPWHRFLSLSGAAAAQTPSAWLISFILVASKEARGAGKGSFNSSTVSAKVQITECVTVGVCMRE